MPGVTELGADAQERTPLTESHTETKGQLRVGPAKPDRRIVVVASRVQLTLLIAAPVVTAIVLVIFARDPMFASGLAAVIVVFVVFQVFASRIPDAFERLRTRGVVADEQLASYPDFKADTQRALNRQWAIPVALAFAALAFARFPEQAGGIGRLLANLQASARAGQPMLVLAIIGEVFLGFVLGFVAWRMVVVAWQLIQLGRRYSLRLQVGHPDNCGGFRPLGDLCLWNALMLTVPAIFLGFWIPMAPEFGYGTTYAGLHTSFLGVLVGLAIATFVAPLWTIHLSMRRDAERIREEVDDVGRKIDQISRDLLSRADELTTDETKQISEELKAHEDLYRRTEHLPTWPIDTRIALKFGVAQVVPLLSLTGLSQPIIDLVGSIVDAVRPGS